MKKFQLGKGGGGTALAGRRRRRRCRRRVSLVRILHPAISPTGCLRRSWSRHGLSTSTTLGTPRLLILHWLSHYLCNLFHSIISLFYFFLLSLSLFWWAGILQSTSVANVKGSCNDPARIYLHSIIGFYLHFRSISFNLVIEYTAELVAVQCWRISEELNWIELNWNWIELSLSAAGKWMRDRPDWWIGHVTGHHVT